MGSESTQPLVSICMPIYNGVKYIPKAFETISQQTYPNIEIIVTNDGSTDETEQKVHEYLDKYGLNGRVLTTENRGGEAARDYACSQATGEYIAPLDVDDIWVPDYLTQMVATIQKKPDAGLIYCDFLDYDERTGEGVKKSDISPWIKLERAEKIADDAYYFEERIFFRMLLLGQVLFPSATLYKKEIFDQTGGYWKELQLQISTDWDFGLRVSLIAGITYLDKPILTKLRHDANLSGNQLKTSECDIIVLKNLMTKFSLSAIEKKLANERLSARCYDAGYCYFMDDDKKNALARLVCSFKAKPRLRSLRLIVASLIPRSLIKIIKS